MTEPTEAAMRAANLICFELGAYKANGPEAKEIAVIIDRETGLRELYEALDDMFPTGVKSRDQARLTALCIADYGRRTK